jgi:dTDP-4-dehydrorhamnose reductase
VNAIVTGLNGTVAPALAHALRERGYEVAGWDRSAVPADDPETGRRFIREVRPGAFFHVATGPPEWAEAVARACAEEGVPFLFTSSVSVFSDAQQGPFEVEAIPEPSDDYGRYKLDCERRVRAAHPEAVVARLGWQIGAEPGGNHMVDHLHRKHRKEGAIAASTRWRPACSFLPDTAIALAALLEAPPGLYHLDGNPGLSFFEIATGLNALLGDPWRVDPAEEPDRDGRMLDPRPRVRLISEWFAASGAESGPPEEP